MNNQDADMMGTIVNAIAETISSMDEALLALVSAHNKLKMQGYDSSGPFSFKDISSTPNSEQDTDYDNLDIDEVIARMEIKEALSEYAKKRYEFEINLHYLQQHANDLMGKPTIIDKPARRKIIKRWKENLNKGF